MTVLQEIKSKAFTLPLPERGQLIHDLIADIDQHPEYLGDFEKEIQRRVHKIKSGQAIGISAADVFSRIEAEHR